MSSPNPSALTFLQVTGNHLPEVGVLGLLTWHCKVSVGGLRHGVGLFPGPRGSNHEIAAIFKGNDAGWVGGLRAVQGGLQAGYLRLKVSGITAVLTPLDKKRELLPAWL